MPGATPAPARTSSPWATSTGRRDTVRPQNAAVAIVRAPATMRSTRPGGSIRSARQRANKTSTNTLSAISVEATSAPSHAVSLASSSRLASRNPNALRISARWYLIARDPQP